MEGLIVQLLSKNTGRIVMDYLTDPPKLPFIEELKNETHNVFYMLNFQFFYDNCVVDIHDKYKHILRARIRGVRYIKSMWNRMKIVAI